MVSSYKPLERGDLLGVIATSSPAKQERFEAGLRVLEAQGFKPVVVGDPFGEYGTDKFLFASAPAAERAANLMKLFQDPSIKAVIGVRGAGGVIEVLPLLDTQVFLDNPKPFIGFSDSTALLVALQNLGCPVVHGPHVESFTQAATEPEVQDSADALGRLLTTMETIKGQVLTPVLAPGDFEGTVTGGNLSVLAALCGTPWQLKAAKRVVLLEDTHEKPHRVHRMLTQLRLSGALNGVAGLCLGAFTKCEADAGPNLDAVIKDALSPLGVPVYSGVPSGHIKGNIAVPYFGTARVTANKLTVYLN